MIVGPANCVKTFILKPLQKIFHAFSNPISWQNLLKLFEGDAVHIAAPKAHFSKDIVMDKDTPIFATSISRIRSYSIGRINERKTEMMEVRMKTFSFCNQFQQHEIKEIPPGPKYFADLVFEK